MRVLIPASPLRLRRVLPVIVIVLLTLTGCAQNKSNSTISINGVLPVRLEVSEVNSPLRVIALANGSAEIISALGMKSVLVGRDIASTDQDLADIPIVNSIHQIIPEKIISLSPDLVLIDASSGPASAIDTLKRAGIKVITITESWTIADIAIKVGDVARALDVPDRGAELIAKIERGIASITPRVGKKPTVAFLYLRGTSAIYLMGGPGSGADALIEAAGGLDVGAARLPNPFNPMTSEALVASNPDIFLLMTKGLESVGGIDALVELPGIAQTQAGKFKRIVTIDDSLFLSFGPRTPNLVLELQRAFDQALAP
jgi:iron complex transport system substrate-binding protein